MKETNYVVLTNSFFYHWNGFSRVIAQNEQIWLTKFELNVIQTECNEFKQFVIQTRYYHPACTGHDSSILQQQHFMAA